MAEPEAPPANAAVVEDGAPPPIDAAAQKKAVTVKIVDELANAIGTSKDMMMQSEMVDVLSAKFATQENQSSFAEFMKHLFARAHGLGANVSVDECITVVPASQSQTFHIAPWQLSWRREDCIKGPSDQNVINSVVLDFLHEPYASEREPLDVLFFELPAGAAIPSFGIGYSIGVAKAMACLSIFYALQNIQPSDDELRAILPEIAALFKIKAVYDPATSMEEQVKRSLSRKIRVTERPRPHVLQFISAFSRTLMSKRAKGDKRPDNTVLAAIIKEYNQSQAAKQRLTSDERDAVLFLFHQTPLFQSMLREHWKNFPVKHSAVPVSLLAKPFLSSSCEPPVRRATHPKLHAALSSSPAKLEAWLCRCIGKYAKEWHDCRAQGKSINIASMGPVFRHGNDSEMVRHSAFLYQHFEPSFKTVVSLASYEEIIARHRRGTLDRELGEKVKAQDDNVEVSDFRFVVMMTDYKGPTGPSGGVDEDAAAQNKLRSELNLDLIYLENEGNTWGKYVSDLKLWRAESHNAKTNELEVVFL